MLYIYRIKDREKLKVQEKELDLAEGENIKQQVVRASFNFFFYLLINLPDLSFLSGEIRDSEKILKKHLQMSFSVPCPAIGGLFLLTDDNTHTAAGKAVSGCEVDAAEKRGKSCWWSGIETSFVYNKCTILYSYPLSFVLRKCTMLQKQQLKKTDDR